MDLTQVGTGKIIQTKARQKKKKLNPIVLYNISRLGIVLSLLAIWELAVYLQWVNSFLMGSPLGILNETVRLIQSGQLFSDMLATVYGTIMGFIIGSVLGSVVGLLLWYSTTFARIIDPFIVALNGLPKIALAPMIIIWFGSGMFSKIALAGIATFIVALLSAYQGTHQIDSNLVNLMRSLGASKGQIFKKVVFPSSMPWIISAFRLNIGFALIAVIGGEFISSDKGLGRMIFVAGNLFNLNVVWVGVLTLMAVAIFLYVVVSKMESRLIPWDAMNKQSENQ
ncbi:ABC transporter permease [Bacillus canaveralius]|uniref:ABC transporter permease n=1 Tax=Bacillus canaveralius TaxID=1403243 RepID=A0A2N5GND7_9BACI|nr:MULTISPECIES: ABC transporter permease [Bacillus]PLR75371.1 ABC transporter permease [Bacillus sp. V3-13]PLR83766.1 ABC transporter permease [Bacillus canaveralius]PLR86694.1 ABC transporter permease [Bacillus sp. V33-4]PLR96452.1 ABC transporter permease [Bacillus canaveralius]